MSYPPPPSRDPLPGDPSPGGGTSDPRQAQVLQDLNPEQREAVLHESGPLLVVAGAGTGKTRVLTRRVAWLIAGGLPAHAVLAITFTNKAADELRRRLESLPGGMGVWAGTFHGFGSFLLRRHGEEIGIDPAFTILDRDDQRSLLRTIMKDIGLDPGLIRPAEASAFIGSRKNAFAVEIPYGLAAEYDKLYDAYVERLRMAQLLDFDDLLLEAKRLLEEAPHVAQHYQRRFAHVLVDEYQDTNLVQRDILLLLAGPASNVTVVGDPDQSIYRWRGAAIGNILEFPEQFPGSRTVLLERNYRSTANILAASEAVIQHNTERHAKRLTSTRDVGSLVTLVRVRDAAEEGRLVAQQVQAWKEAGRSYGDMAVFYRVNALSRAVELALNEAGLPYVIVAGTEFFQRREVKDVLAYARLVENPRDEAAFLRAVNVPRRGVGAASLTKLRMHALANGLSLLDAARAPADAGVRGRAAKGLKSFVDLMDAATRLPKVGIAKVLETLIEGSGYRSALADSPDELERSRVENIEELVAYAREYVKKVPEGTLTTFLERTSLVSDQDGYDQGVSAVNLMSVHAAKGLEFPCVLIVGAEEGYFPHARNADDPAAVEEERRLFYVAMTRARDALVISYTASRQTYQGPDQRRPSSYLGDIPDTVIDERDLAYAHGGGGWQAARPRWAVQDEASDSAFEEPADFGGAGDDVPVVREHASGYVVGERVRHAYFGDGVLEALSGRGGETRLTVAFDSHGRKQFLLRYAHLEKIS